MPSSKRQKKGALVGEGVRWLLFCPYDDLFRYVRVDRNILREHDCRSYKMVQSDPPHSYYNDEPVWNVGLTHCQLVCFVKSLHGNELVIPKDCTYKDAVRMLDYEGIGCPGLSEIKEPEIRCAMLHPSSQAFGEFTAEEPNAENVARVCTLVANAIVEWPRPRIMLCETLQGKDTDNSCSASRFWVRFAPCPRMEKYGGDELYALAKKRPMWLLTMLNAIGYAHCELVRRNVIESGVRDEPSFTKLANHVKEKDPTRYYLSVKRDMPKHHREINKAVIKHADRWAAWVLNKVDEHGSANDTVQLSPNDDRRTRRGGGDEVTRYARAAIALAEDEMRHTPNCYKLFNGDCSDDDKKNITPERKVLEKALKQRGVKIVRWRDEPVQPKEGERPMVPLVFPPSFYSRLIGDGPCALIEMDVGSV